MPVDPMIARGGVPLDVTNTLARIAGLQQVDRRTAAYESQNALMERRYAEQQAQEQAAAEQEAEQVAQWLEAMRAGDVQAAALINPEATLQAVEAQRKVAPPAPIAPPTLQQEGGYSYLFDPSKGVIPGSVQQPQQAPKYAPSEAEKNWKLRMSLPPEQRAEFDRVFGKGGASGSTVSVGPDGQLVVDVGKASEGERVSAGYLGRMREAEAALGAQADYVPSTPAFMAFASLLDDETGVIGGTVANWALNDTDRQYLGAALDFILAKMRKESGATIKGGEFRKEYINYFPMPDDSPAVLEAKRRKRRTAVRQLEISSGRAEGAAAKPEAEPIIDLPTPR